MGSVYFLAAIIVLVAILACLNFNKEHYTTTTATALQKEMADQRYKSAISQAHMELYNKPIRPDDLSKAASKLASKVSVTEGVSTSTLVDLAKSVL